MLSSTKRGQAAQEPMAGESYNLKRPAGLTARMMIVMSIVLAVTWSAFYGIAVAAGQNTVIIPIVLSVFFVGLQYLAGPWIIKWTMGVRWVTPQEEPELHRMVAELSAAARVPMPQVGISSLEIPNAFAFGRWRSDGRVCVTEPLLGMLTRDELRAVLGHEIMHLRNRDVAVITFLSLLPNIFYYIFRIGIRMRGRKSPGPLIALGAILVYFLLELLVLYVSRIREYAADEGSVRLGNRPETLASALFKLVHGAAVLPREALQGTAGFKAFFASDPSRAGKELMALAAIDADGSGSIDAAELARVRQAGIRRSATDSIVELLSTHPNMGKRLERLSKLQPPGPMVQGLGPRPPGT